MKIRLRVDLPVEKRHRCRAGNVYTAIDVKRDEPLAEDEYFEAEKEGCLRMVGFVAESGETVYASPAEFDIVSR